MRKLSQILLALTLILPALAATPLTACAEFGLGISAGGYTGDRLYTASSPLARKWINPTGESSAFGNELLVDLESFIQLGLNAFVPLQGRLGLRFDLAFTDIDVDGKVRDQGGTSETVSWEQFFIFDMVAQATWRLGRSDNSYPYLALGPSLTVSSSEGTTLDQTMPGFAYGAGWRVSALAGSYLDIGFRGQVQWPDFDEEEQRLAADEFEGESTISALSASVVVGYVF
ncbi:hypothetical protein DRQ53_05320 [bacterium]|nr:MAG: hypothetical protein DRQ53_05320 [bacterium]